MAVSSTNKIFIIVAIVVGIGGIVFYLSPSFLGDSDDVDFSDFVQFTNINHTNITDTSAVIIATTNIPVFCEIEYAEFEKDAHFATDSDVNTEPHTEHSILISDLKHTTPYNYQFRAESDGQMSYSDVRQFFTTR